jgi:hypothetical protein
MTWCQLRCFVGFWFLWDRSTWTEVPGPCGLGDVQGSSVKDSIARCFQLESLILAQNERWRQA